MYPKGQNETPKVLISKRFRGCNIYSCLVVLKRLISIMLVVCHPGNVKCKPLS